MKNLQEINQTPNIDIKLLYIDYKSDQIPVWTKNNDWKCDFSRWD